MSFECPHCGFTNNEIQSAGRIQEKGCTMKLSVSSPEVQALHVSIGANLLAEILIMIVILT